MDIRSDAITRIIAANPRQSIHRTLGSLVDRTAGSAAGLFAIRHAGPELVSGRAIDELACERVRNTWQDAEQNLRSGRPTCAPTWCIWPLDPRRGPIGLVYVIAHRNIDVPLVREAIEALGDLLTTALEQEALPRDVSIAAIDSYLSSTPRDEIERRQLVSLLDHYEWNISRVARALGVTRPTIYHRLNRLGIERIHVRKGTA